MHKEMTRASCHKMERLEVRVKGGWNYMGETSPTWNPAWGTPVGLKSFHRDSNEDFTHFNLESGSPVPLLLSLMGSHVAQNLVVHLGFPETPRHLLGSQLIDRY